MKRIIFLAVLFLLTLGSWQARAQWSIGGTIGGNHSFKNNTSNINFRPDVSYSWGSLSAGVSLLVEYYRDYNSSDPASVSLGLSPYVQYYFWEGKVISLLVEGGLDVYRSINVSNTFTRLTPYISPGIEISLSEHWSLVGYVGRLEYDSYSQTIEFDLGNGGFSAGVYYAF